MRNSNDDDDDDAVGYRKPPKEHQFKPGQSGNPRGRPVRNQSMRASILEELKMSITVTENGRTRKMPKDKAIVVNLINKALRGDLRAILAIQALVHEEEQIKMAAKSELRRFTLIIGEKPPKGFGPDGRWLGDDAEQGEEPDDPEEV